MTNAMGGANLHTPPSIFQHMMGQQNPLQQPGPWMQMPQVPPLSMPWSVPSLQQPEVVRFTGGSTFEPILHKKRKLEEPDVIDIRRSKQFISEEKMAAHFKDLHISPNYPSETVTASSSTADVQSVTQKELNMELEVDTANAVDADQAKTSHPRLVISEELKRLQQEPILPALLLSKLERPPMALVLWEPPSKHLLRILSTPGPSSSDDNVLNNSNNNNNNSEGIPDLNQSLSSNGTASGFEPMEL